jgi:hypothetical protein
MRSGTVLVGELGMREDVAHPMLLLQVTHELAAGLKLQHTWPVGRAAASAKLPRAGVVALELNVYGALIGTDAV